MQFVHAVLSLHIAQNSQISQTSQTVRSGFDQFVLWYGNLPQLAQTAITVVVGAIVVVAADAFAPLFIVAGVLALALLVVVLCTSSRLAD